MHVQAQRAGGGLFKFAIPMLKGGGWLLSHFSCFMPKEDLVPIAQGTGWALGAGLEGYGKPPFHWDSVTRPSSL